jgi:SAM-dependent methyltransferase
MAKTDTRSIGLDVGLAFSKFLTGKENLHYGLWSPELEVCAANVGRAQEAYTEKLFRLLPEGPLRILDIGGGAGETAKKLLSLGHSVDIVIPSPFLADRCRANAPGAKVHECMFEDFETAGKFDLCLFSESFQYIPMDVSLAKCLSLLDTGGQIIVSDCFRTPEFFTEDTDAARVGGGHGVEDFRTMLADGRFDVISNEDITEAVAPTVEVEQDLFNVIGYGVRRVDEGLKESHPVIRGILAGLGRLALNKRRRERVETRLHGRTRSAEAFCRYNRYLMVRLQPKG